MFKRVAWVLLFLILSVVTLGYVFRMPITQWLVAPTLSQSGVELHCLDWSINSKLDLHVERVCITYLNHQLELGDIVANTEKVRINRANLRLSEAKKVSSADASPALEKLALNLPAKRPLLHIERLEITHSALNKPLITAISEPTLNTFTLTGDINAHIDVTAEQLSGQLQVNDELLANITPVDGLVLNTTHDFRFDGVSVDLSSKINVAYQKKLNNCPLDFVINGALKASYQLNQQQLKVDASQLNNQLNAAPECLDVIANAQQRDYLSQQQLLAWQLSLPEELTLDKQQLSASNIKLTASNQQASVAIDNASVNLDDPFYSAEGQLRVVLQNQAIENLAVNASLAQSSIKGDYDIELAQLPDFLSLEAQGVNAKGKFLVANILAPLSEFTLHTELGVDAAGFNEFKFNNYQAKLSASVNKYGKAQLQLDSKLAALGFNDYQLTGITNQLTANTDLSVGELFVDLTAETKLKKFNSNAINANNIRVSSKGLQSRALQASHHIFVDGIELVANHNVSAVAHPFEVIIPSQAVTKLNPLVEQLAPLLKLTDGTLNGHLKGDVNLQEADFNMQVNQVSGLYNDYLAKHFSSEFSGEYNSGQLNVTPTTLTLPELRAGAVVKNVTADWQVNNNQAQVSNVYGEVMGGSFVLDQYRLLDTPQQARIEFKNIDASKVITLDDKSGITLTGQVNGTLPVYFDEQGIAVKGGELHSQGEGKLIIADNAAFDAVKLQQQELAPILGLLENLDIKRLTSSVNLKPDGWLYLGVNLKGYNQAEQQEVNFNYNHQENVFTLLRALRLSDEITQKVEQQYSK